MHPQLFTSEYIRRLTSGDYEIERHFTVYFSELLLIKLRRVLRDTQFVEDVRQETFFRVLYALRHRSGLSSPEKLGAFVYGVCNNVLSEHYRAVSRHAPLPDKGPDPPALGLDPEAEFVNEERKRWVTKILEHLPSKDRLVLRLVFLEEREKDEVCRICKVDRSYLRVLLHRAKNRFREVLPKKSQAASMRAGYRLPNRTVLK